MDNKDKDLKTRKIYYWRELILTFSNKKSLFSSKKIERAIVFSVFIILTIIYLITNIHTINPIEFVEIVALWLAYGGWNAYQTYRDRKLNMIDIIKNNEEEVNEEDK